MNKKRKFGFWLRFFRFFLRIKYRKCSFHHIDILDENGIILSNHNFSIGPAVFSFYFPYSIKIWANSRFVSSLFIAIKNVYNYLHVKKHKSKFVSFLISIFGGPWVYWDFKASPIVSVYSDMRFVKTMKESIDVIKDKDYLLIFPEDSTDGYDVEIEKFLPGFIYVLDKLMLEGIATPIYIAVNDKKGRNVYFKKKYSYSSLKEQFKTKEELMEFLRIEMNDLIREVNDIK